jgi:PadR family transcriptional regulator, regulatory protein PadR
MARRSPNKRPPLKPVEFLVLAILENGPLHGYGIVQEMATRTGGRVSPRPGDLYRILYRLDQWGLLVPDERQETDEERRSYYRLTDLGQRVLLSEAQFLSKIAAETLSKRGDRPAEVV